MSLNLAGNLESCAKIAELYSEQVDTPEEKHHYIELQRAIEDIRYMHTSGKLIDELNFTVRYRN